MTVSRAKIVTWTPWIGCFVVESMTVPARDAGWAQRLTAKRNAPAIRLMALLPCIGYDGFEGVEYDLCVEFGALAAGVRVRIGEKRLYLLGTHFVVQARDELIE